VAKADWNLQDWKMTNNIAGVEIAEFEFDGLKMTEAVMQVKY